MLKYIRACACGAWSITTWLRLKPEQRRTVPFKCRSWRHEGECRQWKGAQDFVRCRDAMLTLDAWSYLVLTYKRFGKTPTADLFRAGCRQWDMLRKRLIREFGTIKYIQTWEVHKDKWPHVNIAISNVEISAMCVIKTRDKDARRREGRAHFRRIIRDHAAPCGFGYIGYLEAVHTREKMAGYLTKLSRELTGAGAKSQVPVDAPKGFRRLRASVGLLEPAYTNPEVTGELNRCDEYGEIVPF